jgi:hypothetical protein
MRDITNAPDHVVIVDTGSMIVITAGDGRTLRLSPDGKKIKEANTGIERKTTWTGDKLVSEISGLAPDKITETYSVDPDSHRMRITVEVPGAGRNAPARTVTHIYDADAH